MPFIHPLSVYTPSTTFILLKGVTQHLGVSSIARHLAETYTQQNHKVLIFDALLGLKNYPIKNSNTSKITAVLNGLAPLSDLIVHDKGIDVIAGSSQQNLNAIDPTGQQKIKSDLMKLALNYQVVIIDHPASIIHSLFEEFDNVIYVSTPDPKTLLKTLQMAAKEKAPKLILNNIENDEDRNQAHLFVKNVLPKCQIVNFFK